MLINSDTLYLPILFRDIVIDKAKDIKWFVPPATCFFPDLVIYFIINLFTKNFIAAKLITGIILNILLLLGLFILLNESVYKIKPLHASIGINLMLLFHFVSLFDDDITFSFYLTATNYHLGAYIVSIFCFYFIVRYIKTKKFSNLVIILLLYILTFSSDFLTIFHLTVPLFIMNFLLLKKGYRQQAFYLLATNCLGLIGGYSVYHLINTSNTFYIFHINNVGYLKFNFHSISNAYSVIFNFHFSFLKETYIGLIIYLLSLISFVLLLFLLISKLHKYYSRKTIDKFEINELVYLLLVISQIVVLYNAPLISGIFSENSMFRYNVYVFFMLIFNYAYLFYILSRRFRFSKYTNLISFLINIAFALLSTYVFIKTDIKKGAKTLFNYYPDYIEKVDELGHQHNLKYGLADFWLAKPITMLSKENLKVYQTYPDLYPYPHVVNLNWYYGTINSKSPSPLFDFVLLNNLNDSIVFKRLEGHITDTLKNGNITILKVEPFAIDRSNNNLLFMNKAF